LLVHSDREGERIEEERIGEEMSEEERIRYLWTITVGSHGVATARQRSIRAWFIMLKEERELDMDDGGKRRSDYCTSADDPSHCSLDPLLLAASLIAPFS
jgi:hypothetical protein